MIKSVLKEFIILILMLIVITLLFIIIFYDYNPINKIIPSKVVAYELPEEVKKEIENDLENEEEKIIKTYQVDKSDLDNYKNQNQYEPGKIEPYSLQESAINDIPIPENNEIGEPENNVSNGIFFNIIGK